VYVPVPVSILFVRLVSSGDDEALTPITCVELVVTSFQTSGEPPGVEYCIL
jgi:hypothetical protein